MTRPERTGKTYVWLNCSAGEGQCICFGTKGMRGMSADTRRGKGQRDLGNWWPAPAGGDGNVSRSAGQRSESGRRDARPRLQKNL